MKMELMQLKTNKIEQESPNLMDLILGHKIDLVIDTPSQGNVKSHDGFLIRRNAIETGVNVFTSLDTANALLSSLEHAAEQKLTLVDIATVKLYMFNPIRKVPMHGLRKVRYIQVCSAVCSYKISGGFLAY